MTQNAYLKTEVADIYINPSLGILHAVDVLILLSVKGLAPTKPVYTHTLLEV